MVNINDFKDIKLCAYKGEHYFVRDNDAMLRQPKIAWKIRKLDNLWTFWNIGDTIKYLLIVSNRIQRIVVFVFHSEPPQKIM